MYMTYEIAKQLFEYKNDTLYWKSDTNHTYSGKPVSPSTKRKYLQLKYKKKLYYIHRIVFLLHNGYMPKYVDHINRNKHDNRIENLRACTVMQNMANSSGWSNRSLPKGVSMNGNNYTARIMVNNKQIRLGTYKTIEEAKNAYISKSLELNGQYSSFA